MSRLFVAAAVLGLVACTDRDDMSAPESEPATTPVASAIELSDARAPGDAHTALSGGATTVFDVSIDAFSLPAPNLAGTSLARHEEGDEGFEDAFVPAPAPPSTRVWARSSTTSHARPVMLGDGRGRPPQPGRADRSRSSSASSVAGRGPTRRRRSRRSGLRRPAPAAGRPRISTGGERRHQLRRPARHLRRRRALRAARATVHAHRRVCPAAGRTCWSRPRVAPVVFGLGLLEAVPEGDVLARADPSDRNRDGISGRANHVWDAVRRRTVLGRFGWKANAPNLVQQTAGAYNGDMGVTSSLFPAESCEGQDPRLRAARARRWTTRPSATSRSTPGRSACPRGATWTIPRPRRASGCSTRPVARAATRHAAHRHAARRARGVQPGDPPVHRSAAARHGRRAWRTTARTSRPRAASGGRRRSGASAWCRR